MTRKCHSLTVGNTVGAGVPREASSQLPWLHRGPGCNETSLLKIHMKSHSFRPCRNCRLAQGNFCKAILCFPQFLFSLCGSYRQTPAGVRLIKSSAGSTGTSDSAQLLARLVLPDLTEQRRVGRAALGLYTKRGCECSVRDPEEGREPFCIPSIRASSCIS